MAKSLAFKTYFTAELPNLIDLVARKFRALKTVVAFTGIVEDEITLTDWQKYDSGESDLRPIAQYSNTQGDHQNSLDAMLMRRF